MLRTQPIQRTAKVLLDPLWVYPTRFTKVWRTGYSGNLIWNEVTNSFVLGNDPVPERKGARVPFVCLTCRLVLAENEDNRLLLVGSWIIHGRTELACPHCRRVRRWQPVQEVRN